VDGDQGGLSDALEELLALTSTPLPITPASDSDQDGLYDYLELRLASERHDPDSPLRGGGADVIDRTGPGGDGLSDALEAVLLALGARAPVTPRSDTDQDGIPDGYEVRSGTHPLRGDHPLEDGAADLVDATGPRDTISDALEALLLAQGALAPVTRASDSDLDRAPDHLEVFAGSLPFDLHSPVQDGGSDSDQDRLSAALERVLELLGASPPLGPRSDTDRDGAPDGFEVETAAHPVDGDVPILDGAGAAFDVVEATGPNGDGISDALELLLIRIGCRPPIGPASDTDRDGLPDYFEVRSGTLALDGDSPLENGGTDSDDSTGPAGDGISDALDAFLIARGASGPVTLASDTDGDGVPDFYEVFKGSDPFDALDFIAPGSKPVALDPTLTGIAFEGRSLHGGYRYADAELDPEGATRFRWLREGVEIPGEVGRSHVVTVEDVGRTLTFEVTPESLFAWPPATRVGDSVRKTQLVPVPTLPRGTGGPGGVGVADGRSDLRLWLRADEGVSTLAEEVFLWSDLSGYRRDATSLEVRKRPDLVADVGPRRVPAVRFGGDDHLSVPRPAEDDFTLVVAFASTSLAGSPSAPWWSTPAILGGEISRCDGDYQLGLNVGKALFAVDDRTVTSSASFADGRPHSLMAARLKGSGELTLAVDGTLRGSAAGSTATLGCAATLFLGSSKDGIGFWTGDLFEVCAFGRALEVTERNLVEAYLAARLGTTPARELYAFGATHGVNVAGIGRHSTADFVDQAEGQGLLQVSRPSALLDGDYLVWGTDTSALSLSTDVPAPFEVRLASTWAHTITDGGNGGGVGTVTLRFRVGGLFLTASDSAFALLLDHDGEFSDARVYAGPGTYSPTLETIEFRFVTLGPEPFFALAVSPQ
jgi:hypothetical protein